MILFIAITATLNLCIGYVLGVSIGELPSLPRRRPVEPPEPTLDLSATEAPPEAKPKRKRKKKKTEPQQEPAADAAPAPEPAVDDSPSEPTAAPEPEAEPTAEKPSTQDLMRGLADFQAQLAEMGEKMKETVEDEQAFGECAEQLQQANHDYLEQAQHTIEGLGAGAADSEAASCREVIEKSTQQVGDASEQIDTLLADGVADEKSRAAIVETTEQLSQVIETAEDKIKAIDAGEPRAAEAPDTEPAEAVEAGPEAAAEPEPEPEPKPEPEAPGDGLATLDAVLQVIDTEVQAGADHLFVAAIAHDELDPRPDDAPEDLESRLLSMVGRLAAEVAGESSLIARHDDNRLLMLLEGESVEDVSQRVEQLRQMVEKTQVKADGVGLSTTVTCAVTDSMGEADCDEMLKRLDEALAESEQHGKNRSYHHDGHFAAPLLLEGIKARGRTVEV